MASNPPFPQPDPLATRQLRRCTLPTQKLVEYIDRRTGELTNARIHHEAADHRAHRLFLYIETDTAEGAAPRPLELALDWNEVFGSIPCEVSGEMTPVEEITVSRKAAAALLERIRALEEQLGDRAPNEGKLS